MGGFFEAEGDESMEGSEILGPEAAFYHVFDQKNCEKD
jgi:hypothetical protein